MTADWSESGRREGLYFVAFASFILALGLAGYVGYELYPRFDIPAVDGVALLALAASAGVASFFSPCSFSLLLTILGADAGLDDDGSGNTVDSGRAVALAGAVSVGAAAFVLLLGMVIAFGGRALVGDVVFTSPEGRILRAGVGGFLVAAGLVQIGALPAPLHSVEGALRPLIRVSAEQRRKRPLPGAALFGFGYLLAGFG